MKFNLLFIVNSILFGIGLAMDAFSVSMVNGLIEPHMPARRKGMIAGIYCFFQILMPLLGWVGVHFVATAFSSFQKFIPWIALLLLLYIGGEMLLDGIRKKEVEQTTEKITFATLIVQGVATSIDALSVGFTIADYNFVSALVESIIIGVVTFVICIIGLELGQKFGTKLSSKANILGGCILIGIGIEIFVQGLLS